MKILILYFSGTGNTKFIAEKLSKRLKNRNFKVYCQSIELFKPENTKNYDFLIFASPVYGFAIPSFLEDYLKKLTLTKSKGVFTITTVGYDGGNAMRKSAKLFKSIGFIPVLNIEFIMPGNDGLIIKEKDSEKVKKVLKRNYDKSDEINNLIEKIIKKVAFFENKKLNEKDINIPEIKFSKMLLDPVMKFSFYLFEEWLAKKYHADEKCTLCGYCEKICPANNIIIKNDQVHFGNDCYYCLRCINQCPEEAIQITKFTKNKFRFKGPMENYKPAILEENN